MKISIIICTRNRRKILSKTLKTIFEAIKYSHQSKRKIEVIIVDNASYDDTKEFVLKLIMMYSNINLKYVIEPTVGVSYARNTGIKNAVGNVISFIDDDTHLTLNWVQSAILAINSQSKNKIIFGEIVAPKLLTKNKIIQDLNRLNSLWSIGITNIEVDSHSLSKNLPIMVNNSLIQKKVFEKIGVFDTDFGSQKNGYSVYGGEDIDFIERAYLANFPMQYNPQLVVNHIILQHKISWDYIEWRHYANGIERAIFWSKYPNSKSNKNLNKTNLKLYILWTNILTKLFWPLKYLPFLYIYSIKYRLQLSFIKGYNHQKSR